MPVVRIYCPRPSDGARDLIAALKAQGVRAVRVREWAPKRTWRGLVVNWGAAPPMRPEEALEEHEWPGYALRAPTIPVLNGFPTKDKKLEAEKLREALGEGAPWPEPRNVFDPPLQENGMYLDVRGKEWLGRTRNHQEARDLRFPRQADVAFFVQKLPIIREFRCHVFQGKVIRSGMKVPRPGFENPHPWIRSFDSGWNIDYGNECQKYVRQRHRDLAKAAVAALGLDFGAVDIGIVEGSERPRRAVVFEVNTAPSLSNPQTAAAYARHIKELLR